MTVGMKTNCPNIFRSPKRKAVQILRDLGAISRQGSEFSLAVFGKSYGRQIPNEKHMHMLYPAHPIFPPCQLAIGRSKKTPFSKTRVFGALHGRASSSFPPQRNSHCALWALPLRRHCCAGTPRPARGAPLASSLAGFFRETGGQWGPHPRTSPCAPVWPTASAYGYFASEKSKP